MKEFLGLNRPVPARELLTMLVIFALVFSVHWIVESNGWDRLAFWWMIVVGSILSASVSSVWLLRGEVGSLKDRLARLEQAAGIGQAPRPAQPQ